MMRGKIRFLVKAFVALSLLSVAVYLVPTESVAAEKKELNMTHIYVDRHPTVINAFKPWIKEIQEKTDGKVDIKYFNPGSLVPRGDEFDSTVSGAVDIGGYECARNPGKFPLNDAIYMPGIVPSAEAGSLVVWDLYNKFPEWRAEFKEIKLLWQWVSATFQVNTTKKLVRTLDDLKGMKIIGWNPLSLKILKHLGANPIQLHPLDTYLALERGMADGVLAPIAPLRSFKISDAAKYTTVVDLFVAAFWEGMNRDLWNSLSPEIQKVFMDTTGRKMARASGISLDEGAARDAEWLKERGHTFYVPPPDELQRFKDALKPIHENWVNDMEKKGYKMARQVLDEAIRLGKEYAKTTGRGYKE